MHGNIFSTHGPGSDWEDAYDRLLQALVSRSENAEPEFIRQNRTGDDDMPMFDMGINVGTLNDDGQRILNAVTTKKLYNSSMMAELIWFLCGDTDVERLQSLGSGIWNEWMRPDGSIGAGYGKMWRAYPDTRIIPNALIDEFKARGFKYVGNVTQEDAVVHRDFDQITTLIDNLVNNPYSRRHVVWAFNPAYVDDTTLPPCHMGFVVQVMPTPVGNVLNLKVLMRSWDTFLGGPFNIASYSALLHLFSQLTGYAPGRLGISGVDVHLYQNHLEQAQQQLDEPGRIHEEPPTFSWDVEEGSGVAGWKKLLERMEALDSPDHKGIYSINDYKSAGPIKAPVAT